MNDVPGWLVYLNYAFGDEIQWIMRGMVVMLFTLSGAMLARTTRRR